VGELFDFPLLIF